MRALNTLSTVGTTGIALGEMQFVRQGHMVYVKARDSVATATLRITVNDGMVFDGPVAIEGSTDDCVWPDDLITQFRIPAGGGNIVATAGGTVAGLRVDFLDVGPDEPAPF